MSKMKWISLVGLLVCSSQAFAVTSCNQTNAGESFRQVVLNLDGGLRCDYGPDPFDFGHSYELQEKYHPASGYWEGSSDPGIVFCRTKTAADCQFYLVKK